MQKPNPHKGLRHVALHAKNLEACVKFYELLGLKIVWQPDADNIYLSSGTDNFALHRAPIDFAPTKHQHLDHLGFFMDKREDVDEWHTFLVAYDVTIK
jgi:catechol 2,3-dioxygenase-like lactoylglutathione lyase family enzyme